MGEIAFHLRDKDSQVVAAWREHFRGFANVHISGGDIFEPAVQADAIVSPANSFGYMDGGIDLVYLGRFGWQLQERLQSHLREQHDGELPVGQAAIVETLDPGLPYLISAPTMRVPMDVSRTPNAYLAFRAAIRAAKSHAGGKRRQIRSILCPGLCTAIGRMQPEVAARQMATAYRVCILGEAIDPHGHSALLASTS
jgi:O-acetyl-ADP-ribose deacetylase (regulator of RNase III)